MESLSNTVKRYFGSNLLKGENLSQSVVNEEGDFIFIPEDLPHQPRNLSDSEPAIAIVSRNDPNEQESVQLYFPNENASV